MWILTHFIFYSLSYVPVCKLCTTNGSSVAQCDLLVWIHRLHTWGCQSFPLRLRLSHNPLFLLFRYISKAKHGTRKDIPFFPLASFTPSLTYHFSNVLSASEFRGGYAQSLLSLFIHLSSAYLPLRLIMVWTAYAAHARISPVKSNRAFTLCTYPSIHPLI